MKSGIHLQKKLHQVVTKDGALVTYRLVLGFGKPSSIRNEKSSKKSDKNSK